MSIYDLIIIGAGPAGITASVYAVRKRMNFLVISKDIGGQTVMSSDIQNYTGYQFITGPDLVKKFQEHLDQAKVEVNKFEEVVSVKKENDIIKVITDSGSYEAKSAIIATGRVPRKLGVKGEDEFKGRGITYCATCDGPLFANKTVAVIGGGNAALDAVLQLINIAKKIYLIDAALSLRADSVMVEKAKQSDKVTIYNETTVQEIKGENVVKGIILNRKDGTEEIKVDGVFVEIGSGAATDFVKDVGKNESGEIIVNCKCETNIPGIYAAGDVTSVPAKQIIVACGEGAKASILAFEYLSKRN